MNNDEKKLNLFILGQTGVGKRSLINALVGHEVEKIGVGKPIAARGIFPHETSIDGKDVVIYNSYWLELDKYEEWERRIRNELYKRGADKDIKDWFHIITYCIEAGGGKIQDFDINIIKQFIENKCNVIVAITKADIINKDKVEELKKIIKKETGVETVIVLAAAPEKTRFMTETPPSFGLEEYKRTIFRICKRNASENYIELNMLILGQTGVGKSSLINALVGYKVEETRIGKPCTPEGIFPHKTSIDGKDVVIYDSWGLESGKSEKWEKILKNELEKRGADKDIKDWFHSVTYCIQAGKAKIQDFDIKIIKQFLENKYNVIVAMTKADQIEESRRKEFIDIIKEETGVETVIAVGAAPERKRGMKETPEPLGLEDYKATTLISWRKIFIDRIPLYIIEKIKIDINKKRDELKNKDFKEEDLNVLSENISKEFQDFIELQINTYYKETIIQYYQISKEMININPNLNISNDKKISGYKSLISDLYSAFDFSDSVSGAASIATILVTSPLLVLGTVIGAIGDIFGLIHFNTAGKKDAINDFIDEKAKNSIYEISKPEFENKLRDGINEILVKIEEELKNRLENNIKE
ncbi:GTPase [Brachyspira pulli]|uniref:GTPase n=1 Tax=Brachyspira pulli TaxID=310721 RepID=UPI003007C656